MKKSHCQSTLNFPPIPLSPPTTRSLVMAPLRWFTFASLVCVALAAARPRSPPAPPAPLIAAEAYRTRVHTGGQWCCPGGASFCNATAKMMQARCSGYRDFGSPQLLLTPNGTLLSFNQAERLAHNDDNNWIDIVVTRSLDEGRSWLPLQVVHSANNWHTPSSRYQSIGQNTAVVDEITNTIHMLFTKNNSELFTTWSGDDGATWAAPTVVSDRPHGCSDCWIAPSFSAIQVRPLCVCVYVCVCVHILLAASVWMLY